jgi:hypothetical protein
LKVKIPFLPRFKEPMLKGTKTWTSRTKRYGEPGDTFDAFDNEFEILKVERRTLEDILEHWKEEGCSSKEDAVEVWRRLHPRRGFDRSFYLSERLYVHIFRRISI